MGQKRLVFTIDEDHLAQIERDAAIAGKDLAAYVKDALNLKRELLHYAMKGFTELQVHNHQRETYHIAPNPRPSLL